MNQWFIIQTKPKNEIRVRDQLVRAQFCIFLPLMKTFFSKKPLFPSYLFVLGDIKNPQVHRLIRFTRGVNRVLCGTDGPLPVPDEVMETLMSRTRSGFIEQELLFKEGDGVLIKRGILKDLRGIIEKNISDEGRVRILFRWLNRSFRASVRYVDLEKAA